MSKKYKIGVIGLAHSHIMELYRSFDELQDRIEWVGFADTKPLVTPVNREYGTRLGIQDHLCEKFGDELFFNNHADVINKNPDIVIVCAENAMHSEIASQLLARGIHVLTEKPMASSMRGALEMVRAAKTGGAKLIVNWPATWNTAVRTMHRLCAEGAIGKIFKFTYRNADSLGALSYGQKITDTEKGLEWWHQIAPGGGVLLDYCCYGACLSSWFIGEQATAAYALKANFNSPYAEAEDYANITARFPSAVAILEGSWTTVNTGIPSGPIVFGLDGTMVPVQTDAGTEIHIFKTRWKPEPDIILSPDPIPAHLDTIAKAVLAHLDDGTPLHPTLDLPLNLQAMSILDAGIRSAESGKMEAVNTAIWTI